MLGSGLFITLLLIIASVYATELEKKTVAVAPSVAVSSKDFSVVASVTQLLGSASHARILSDSGSPRQARTQDDDYSAVYETEDVVAFLFLIGGIILIVVGSIMQCCGLMFPGMTLIAIGVVCWIVAIAIAPTVSDFYMIFPILILLCVAPCWYATYNGKTPVEFYMGTPESPPSSRAESAPLIPPPDSAPKPAGDVEAQA